MVRLTTDWTELPDDGRHPAFNFLGFLHHLPSCAFSSVDRRSLRPMCDGSEQPGYNMRFAILLSVGDFIDRVGRRDVLAASRGCSVARLRK